MKQGPAALLLPLLLLLSGCTGSNRPDATRHITQLEITVWPLKTQRDGTTAPDFSVPETWKLTPGRQTGLSYAFVPGR